jgi:hypothetical protein
VNPHRQHYFDANRQQQRKRHENVGTALAILVLATVALASVIAHVRDSGPQVTPVRMPVITSVDEARIEGFRAGVASCGAQQLLSSPIPQP